MRLGNLSFIQLPPTPLVSLSVILPRQVSAHRMTPNAKRPLKADDLAGEELTRHAELLCDRGLPLDVGVGG